MAFQRKSFMYGFIIGSVSYAIMKWYLERRRRRKKSISFYPDDYCFLLNPTESTNASCSLTKRYCYKLFCCSCNYKFFLALIESTMFSLDICVYIITSHEIAQLLFTLLKRGVYIRIIMDKEMSQSQNSKLVFLMKKNIPVKLIGGKDGQLMHNKFVIIDRRKLITGSFNWTESGFKRNFESGILTYNEATLLKYRYYFEIIWNVQ